MIEKMNFLRITGPKEDLDRVIQTYLTRYGLHVENALTELSTVNDIVPYVDGYNVREILAKSQETIAQLKESKTTEGNELTQETKVSKHITIKEAMDNLSRMHLLLDDLKEQKNIRHQRIKDINQKLTYLLPYQKLDFKFSDMKEYKFIKCQFGRIAVDYYDKMMKFVYEDMDTLFLEGSMRKGFVYGIYFVPISKQPKLDAVFSSLHYEDIEFPPEYDDTPEAIHEQYEEEIVQLKKEIKQLNKQSLQLLKKHADEFVQSYDLLKTYNENAEIRKMAACTRENEDVYYILCGWMSKQDTVSFRKEINKDELVDCMVDDASSSKTLIPPTKLKNPKIFKPFEMFIKMYGLPSYGEIDPTIFVAITYSSLFGMMYGDVGQGLCLVIGGFLFYKLKKQSLCAIMSCAGISSTIFGFLYGSVFGFEDAFEPIWVNPMKDTLTVLLTAIIFGISLILIAMVINIVNGIREKNIQKIFFDTNGVAGLVFYGTVIGTVALLATGHTIPGVAIICVMILVPLVLIFLREPITNLIKRKKDLIPGPKGMFFVQNSFEMFEVLLSYITNTISFVRVGAFALSHAGMMSVVLLLSNASTGHPNIVVLVLGNIFVACLEGLIVGIQVLRLEYYEMFSRFYSGTGKEFKAKSNE